MKMKMKMKMKTLPFLIGFDGKDTGRDASVTRDRRASPTLQVSDRCFRRSAGPSRQAPAF
jgi:hypothetical protein